DHEVADEVFLGLRKRAVGDDSLVIADPHRGGGRGGSELVAAFELLALPNTAIKLTVLGGHQRALGFGQLLVLLVVLIDQEDVFHVLASAGLACYLLVEW